MTKPGFGQRHPVLAQLLAHEKPVAAHDIAWAAGTMPLRVSAYTKPTDVPRDLVSSVRCIVRVGERVVFCENKDGRHPWPGGRRLPDESYADTAAREVHEETGWQLDPTSLRQLGWLHLMYLSAKPLVDGGLYPDFLQLVFTATAATRDGGPDVQWADTEGYELSSRLVTVNEALHETSDDLLAPVFLRLIFSKGETKQ